MSGARIVLLVDDDPDVQLLLGIMLRRRGPANVRLEWAHDGQIGLERVRAGGIDLVLSDVNMPRLNGPEMIAAIIAEGLTVPVVLIGGLLDDEDARHAAGRLDKTALLTDPTLIERWLDGA